MYNYRFVGYYGNRVLNEWVDERVGEIVPQGFIILKKWGMIGQVKRYM